MVVGCEVKNCAFNIAGECNAMCIQISNGFCMTMEIGEFTGEIIDAGPGGRPSETYTEYMARLDNDPIKNIK